MEQRQNPKLNPHLYGQQNFDDNGTQDTKQREDCLLSKQYWKKWISTCKRMKLDQYLIPYTKINSKWIKDLNVRPETLKFSESNILEAS